MTGTENVFDGFALLGDDEEFDVDKIFGNSSDEPAPPPPAPTLAEEVKSQPEPEHTLPAKTQEVPAEEQSAPLELFSAFSAAEEAPGEDETPVSSLVPRPQTQLSLFDKPAVFQYGGAKEQITDVDKLPLQPSSPNTTSREPYALKQRHAAYSEMLSLLTLSDRHRENLHERGLPDEIIARNGYKSMPETEAERRLLASLLACDHELHGLPGFYTKDGTWTLAGANGFLIPVRNKDGLIQGMKIRLDDDAARKYRWLSSRSSRMENGTRSYSWIHITGDTTQKRAYLTEGPLKGDIASYFANNALFVCLGGVNAHKGLRETLLLLGVTEVMEAMDMDQFTNPQVRQAITTLRREVQSIPGIRYYQCTWNPRFKGVDDYLLDWTKRKMA